MREFHQCGNLLDWWRRIFLVVNYRSGFKKSRHLCFCNRRGKLFGINSLDKLNTSGLGWLIDLLWYIYNDF